MALAPTSRDDLLTFVTGALIDVLRWLQSGIAKKKVLTAFANMRQLKENNTVSCQLSLVLVSTKIKRQKCIKGVKILTANKLSQNSLLRQIRLEGKTSH